MEKAPSAIGEKPGKDIFETLWPTLPFFLMCSSANLQTYTRETKWELATLYFCYGVFALVVITGVVNMVMRNGGGILNQWARKILTVVVLAGLLLVPLGLRLVEMEGWEVA